jgi:NAD(P)-dependent dehydrogenase (short-subunit alcohol dehydrogenase family)
MKHKIVLITGVSSGIGEATARALAAAGHRVFGAARTPDKIATMPGVELIRMDVQSDDSVRNGVQEVLERAGRIDVVINNAGVSLVGPVEATSDAEAMGVFDTNVFGVLRVVRAVLPAMRRERHGLVINLSSVLGFLPAPFMGIYAGSKHALEGLSESLDHEVRSFGVRVVLVEPSFTKTKLDTNAMRTAHDIESYGIALSRSIEVVQQQVSSAPEPKEVAKKILAILDGTHRLRRPADGRARLLRFLRRFAPSGMVDKSLRGAFGLQP